VANHGPASKRRRRNLLNEVLAIATYRMRRELEASVRDDPEVQELLDRVRASFQPASSFIGEFGPVMVVHTGPGLAGLAWWWEDRAER